MTFPISTLLNGNAANAETQINPIILGANDLDERVTELEAMRPQLDRCTATTSTTSATTFSTPTGMAGWSLTAGELYLFQFVVRYTAVNGTTGITLQVTYSGTVTASEAAFVTSEDSLNIRASILGVNNPQPGQNSGGTGARPSFITGFVLPLTSGTLSLQFRSETAGSQVDVLQHTFGVLNPQVLAA